METPLAAETIFHIGKLGITNTILMSWVVISTLAILAILGTRKLTMSPGKLQNVLEMIVEAAMNTINDVAKGKAKILLPLLATFFLFILAQNWMGLLPGLTAVGFWEKHHGEEVFVPLLRSGNSDLNITLSLALISVAMTQFYGVRTKKFIGYIKHYFHNPLSGGIVLVIAGIGIGAFVGVLEVISEFVKVISLSFRLFGNVYAGEAVLGTVSGLIKVIAPIPFLMLEFLVGVVQAAVFTLLSLVFMSIITDESAHGEHHEENKNLETISS